MNDLVPKSVTSEVLGLVAPVRDGKPLDVQRRIEDDLKVAESLLQAALSKGTRTTYAHVWRDFETYCRTRGVASLPAQPTTVVAFLTWLAAGETNRKGETGQKFSTVQKAASAISTVHGLKGFESPTRTELVKRQLQGIARTYGVHQDPVAALTADECRKMLAACDDGIKGLRDRLVLLLGFCGAFRRSEISHLEVRDFDFRKEGMVVTVRKSKTDQVGVGQQVAIRFHEDPELCPIVALRRYLDAAQIKEGVLLRGVTRKGRLTTRPMCDQEVWRIVHNTAEACGFERRLGAHSMRAGFVTEAAQARKPLHAIKKKTRHVRLDTLMRYVRQAEIFDDDAAEGLL